MPLGQTILSFVNLVEYHVLSNFVKKIGRASCRERVLRFCVKQVVFNLSNTVIRDNEASMIKHQDVR